MNERTKSMALSILKEAKYDKKGNVIKLCWSPSSSEMKEIARVMRKRGIVFTDERKNVIHFPWMFGKNLFDFKMKYDL